MFAIIALNPKRSGHLVYLYHEMKIDSDGVPVCPIGRKMIFWGKCPGRQRIKWRFPAKVGNWACPTPFSPSEYGRSFYTSTADNPRLFSTHPSRQQVLENPLCAENRCRTLFCIKRQKVDYNLNLRADAVPATGTFAYTWLPCASMLMHGWKKRRNSGDRMNVAEWLQAFDNA